MKIVARFTVKGNDEPLVNLALGVEDAEPLDYLTRALLRGCADHIAAAAELIGTRPFDDLDHVFAEAMKILPQYGEITDDR